MTTESGSRGSVEADVELRTLQDAGRNWRAAYKTCPCGAWLDRLDKRGHVLMCPVEQFDQALTNLTDRIGEWHDKWHRLDRKYEDITEREEQAQARIHYLEGRVGEAESERDQLVALVGETAMAVENENAPRSEIARVLWSAHDKFQDAAPAPPMKGMEDE